MIISEVIQKLKILKDMQGDIDLYLEVGENKSCRECGKFRYVRFCGKCKSVDVLDAATTKCARLLAINGE